jgi:hypothetical protein
MSRVPLYAVLALATGVSVSCSDAPTAPASNLETTVADAPALRNGKGKGPVDRATLLTNVPVSGLLSNGGSFTGTFTAKHIAIDPATRILTVTGILNGTAVSGGVSTAIENVLVSAPATLDRGGDVASAHGEAGMVRPVAMAVCDILFLDLGPLSLDLLGLTLDLNEIVLDLNAVSGAGNLLGNLLCAVVSLLDGPGFLAGLSQLLDSINSILDGLGGLGIGATWVPSSTPAAGWSYTAA